MADTKEKRIRSLYSDLKKCLDSGNEAKIIKAANKILGESDREVEAWRCKLVAMIQLGNFADVVKILAKSRVTEHFAFEKAYAQYRMNDVLGALKTIQECGDSSLRLKELEAQVLYRLERYSDCYSKYRELIKSVADDFDTERLTNLAAVGVHLAAEGKAQAPSFSEDATYEQLYNHGCQALACGKPKEALSLLKKAESLCCQFHSEEGSSPEEILEESAIIRAQQAYCLQVMGKEKEALSDYSTLLKEKHEDSSLMAVINNNVIAMNKEGNLFDSKKRVKALSAPEIEHKLTSFQRATMSLNQALLSYHTHQDAQCEAECILLEEMFPQKEKEAQLLQACVLARLGRLDEMESILQKELSKDPSYGIYASLVAVQLFLNQKFMEKASACLESLQESSGFRNGLTSALISIYMAEGKPEAASRTFKKAVEWHRGKKTSSAMLSELWRHAANFHLRNGDALSAAEALQELKNLNPSDDAILAQLITSYAQFDMKMASELSKDLPAVESLVDAVDAEQLEMSLGVKHYKKILSSKDATTPSTKSPGSEQVMEKKKKKKKKVRLPKHCIPGQEPDPERWLPRWQRKTVGKKKQKRGIQQMKGTQGISSDAADAFDITKMAGQQKPQTNVTSPKWSQMGAVRRTQQKKKSSKPRKK